ncbi:MAG: DNA polymerase III subunit alpha [Candidatus Komeilibacteria bacterium]|nr:DNA polymerase III subunit alpha [Candidatus Komeilibacteria bacterium]
MFVHLHTHSHYSLLDGLPKIPELVKKAKEFKMPALALTDHGSMYGIIEFYEQCQKAGIKPIIGMEAYVAPNSRLGKDGKNDTHPYHLILLAKNNQGYKNLLKLNTLAHLEGFYYKPRIDWELLEKYHDGLIALSACLQGEVARAILTEGPTKAREIILKYSAVFGPDNFYLELQHNPNIPDQHKVNDALIKLAEELNLPLVATNDVHYLNPEDAEAQDILLCIQTKRKQAESDRLTMLGEDFSFWSPEKMAAAFAHVPQALENTLKIAEQCDARIELGKILLPSYEVPGGQTPEDYLKNLCQEGLSKRYPEGVTEEIKQRLDYELGVIAKTGFAPYFLIVQDFVNWAKSNNIVVGPGRGSAPGSLVSYLINVTNIDPIKFELIFERFLNPERVSMPDIDLDFADIRRDEVINYVSQKYGQDQVSQIITFGTMAARAAIRDVGRVLGLSYSFCDRIAKLIPMFMSLTDAVAKVPEIKEIYEADPQAKNLIDFAKKLEGVARHASTHACGVLITPDALDNHVPLQYAGSDDKTVISQYSLHPVEALGLLKMDFLGLKNLTIIETALEIINKTTGQKIDIDKLPLNDEKTFRLLKKGQTTGVFQLESSGMRRYLIQLEPTDIEDIIVMISLYRPGPMELIPDYIAGKRGQTTVTYLHPKLEPILKKTFGIAVYQEQIMQIARDLSGFSYGEADVLRKAVGKKIKSLLVEQEEKMVSGMIKNGVDKKVAKKIWEYILPFARYGFNRAHAACYAMISYQTAYLKANFPTQFMAALLTADNENIDRVALEISECNKMGIDVLPPDINESYTIFTMVVAEETQVKPRIRFGLSAIKNVGEHLTKFIIQDRRANGPFKNLENFLLRTQDKDLNKKSLESLIKCGALDRFGSRGQMLFNIDRLLKFGKKPNGTSNGQNDLFTASKITNTPVLKLDEAPQENTDENLKWEKELLGIYLSEHPLNKVRHLLPAERALIAHLPSLGNGKMVRIAGLVQKLQRVMTKKGQAMYFANLADESGNVEVLVFPKILEITSGLWQEDAILIVDGKITDKDGSSKLICDSVKAVDKNRQFRLLEITITPDQQRDFGPQLRSTLENHPGNLVVHVKIQNKTVKAQQTVTITSELVDQLSNLIGRQNVRFV